MTFLPDGRIAIALKNVADVPVTVNINAPLGVVRRGPDGRPDERDEAAADLAAAARDRAMNRLLLDRARSCRPRCASATPKKKAKPKAKKPVPTKPVPAPEPEPEIEMAPDPPPRHRRRPSPRPHPPRPEGRSDRRRRRQAWRSKIKKPKFYVRAGVAQVKPLAQSRALELADVDGAASLAIKNGPIAGSGSRRHLGDDSRDRSSATCCRSATTGSRSRPCSACRSR